ncbi:MAG TPA: GNAT family N-acetyltransferase [Gaiellales bacterium]|nr:GNAT family N-acetyltransferase [Gaiellales bacterium]
MAAGFVIRPPAADELGRLVAIEAAAGRAFADHGMPEIAADDPGSPAELEAYRAAGRAWVAADRDGPIAYLLAADVDGCLHVEQVSVDPAHAGRGIGAALIEHLADVARADGRPALTLTTFRDIPWNAPYYTRLGFAELAAAGWGPQLQALVAHERDAIPGDHPRVAMIRRLE